jgi:transposase
MEIEALAPDDLWEAIEPFLPEEPPKPRGGRPRVADRAALANIVFVLKSDIPWRRLPAELGCGSGWTCWRRLRVWQAAGVWEKLHERLLNWLGDQATIDWSRASVDSLSPRANGGRADGAESDRSRQTGFEAPSRRRPRRHPARRPPLGGQRPRFDPAGPARGRDTPDYRSSRETAQPTEAAGQAARRQSLRRLGPAACPPSPGHHAAPRPPWDRLVRAARAVPLGGRAHARLATRLSPSRRPLRASADLLQGLLHLARALLCLRFLEAGRG